MDEGDVKTCSVTAVVVSRLKSLGFLLWFHKNVNKDKLYIKIR